MSITAKQKYLIVGILIEGFLNLADAQVPFSTTPNWISSDLPDYSTGAAWADINKDGWLDLVIANGNDMARQPLVVYYNTGTGTLPTTPSWQSDDIDYHGHLSIGDVNNDGYPDVAVSVYIGASGFSQKGKIKLYLNNNGTLSSVPSWVSKDSMYTFSCAFGDADGDGSLDLAVACGESYYRRPDQNRIYYNKNGILDSLPGWKSQEIGYSYDVSWANFDNDGDLDLIFANERGPNRMYRNYGDSIGVSAVWSSTDASLFANSLFVGDVNNDGYLDFAVSDNNQLGGAGRFKIYINNSGMLDTIPFWTSSFSGYGSGIILADIDNDGYRDLITGGWWQPCRIYVNQKGTFTVIPQWTSNSSSVVEAIVFGDFDNDGLDTVDVHLVSDGVKKLFYLPRSPIQRVLSVDWNGDPDSLRRYCYDLENGWLSFAGSPSSGVIITIRAVVSHDLDFAVSNWDSDKGNFIFMNTSEPLFVEGIGKIPIQYRLLQNYPNPFNPRTTIRFELPKETNVTLKVFNILGQEAATLVNEKREAGRYEVQFNASNLTSGVYFFRIQANEFIDTKKLVLLK